MKQSVICINHFSFKLEFIEKMGLAGGGVLFESNVSFQFEVFIRKAKWDVGVGDSVEVGDIFVIIKSRIGIFILEIFFYILGHLEAKRKTVRALLPFDTLYLVIFSSR